MFSETTDKSVKSVFVEAWTFLPTIVFVITKKITFRFVHCTDRLSPRNIWMLSIRQSDFNWFSGRLCARTFQTQSLPAAEELQKVLSVIQSESRREKERWLWESTNDFLTACQSPSKQSNYTSSISNLYVIERFVVWGWQFLWMFMVPTEWLPNDFGDPLSFLGAVMRLTVCFFEWSILITVGRIIITSDAYPSQDEFEYLWSYINIS